jgi:hypothetical protein
MEDGQNLHGIVLDAIGNDEGSSGDDELPCPRYATFSAELRMVL